MKALTLRAEEAREFHAAGRVVVRRALKEQPLWEEEPTLCDDGVWRGRYLKEAVAYDSSGYPYAEPSVGVEKIKPPIADDVREVRRRTEALLFLLKCLPRQAARSQHVQAAFHLREAVDELVAAVRKLDEAEELER